MAGEEIHVQHSATVSSNGNTAASLVSREFENLG